jgi:TonB family protein
MRKELSIFVAAMFILGCHSGVTSQDKPVVPETSREFVAPMVWTRYLVAEQKLSFIMPKLPMLRQNSDPCEERDGAIYQAYAEQVIYEFAWYAKSSSAIPKQCISPKPFGPYSYLQRLADLRKQNKVSETTTKIGAQTATVFRLETPQYKRSQWLIWSIDQWVEMTLTHRRGTEPDEERFVNSVTFSSVDGFDIGPGSPQMIGDGKISTTPANNLSSQDMVTFHKPSPGYTDEARANKLQGKAILSVTFSSNGSIGEIYVEKPLEHGMTKQAIAAAQRIVFLPAIEKGIPVDTVRRCEYVFSIY